MSWCLAERSIDHVVLERGEVANSWRTERWDSLTLLTPNWQSRLPGYGYQGRRSRRLPHDARDHRFHRALRRGDLGPGTDPHQGHLGAAAATMATRSSPTGAPGNARRSCSRPGRATSRRCRRSPQAVPPAIATLTPMQYRNPDQLEEGGVLVVGASASGTQIADEIQRSGRPVTLAVGEHVRVPRVYRGKDIQWWMDAERGAGRALRRGRRYRQGPQPAVAAARGLRRPPHDRPQLAHRVSA